MNHDNPEGQTQYDKIDEVVERLRSHTLHYSEQEEAADTIEALRRERDAHKKEWEKAYEIAMLTKYQLSASQAREQQLQKALEMAWSEMYVNGIEAKKLADAALALPADDTALNAWGAKLLRDAADKLCADLASVSTLPPMISPSLAMNFMRRMADALEKS